jgi:hypothetical protein
MLPLSTATMAPGPETAKWMMVVESGMRVPAESTSVAVR